MKKERNKRKEVMRDEGERIFFGSLFKNRKFNFKKVKEEVYCEI
jgi:hypothetical protein